MKIKSLLTALVAASIVFSPMAFAKEKTYRWRLAETWGPNFPVFGDATKKYG